MPQSKHVSPAAERAPAGRLSRAADGEVRALPRCQAEGGRPLRLGTALPAVRIPTAFRSSVSSVPSIVLGRRLGGHEGSRLR